MAAMARPDRLMLTPAQIGKRDAAHRVEAQGADQDDGGNDQVAGVGEIDLVLNNVAHADGGDHAVQHKADAADDGGGDRVDDGLTELRAES